MANFRTEGRYVVSRRGHISCQVPAAPPREQGTAGPGGWPRNVMGRGGAGSGPVTQAATSRCGSGSPWGASRRRVFCAGPAPGAFQGALAPTVALHSPRLPHPADDLGPRPRQPGGVSSGRGAGSGGNMKLVQRPGFPPGRGRTACSWQVVDVSSGVRDGKARCS